MMFRLSLVLFAAMNLNLFLCFGLGLRALFSDDLSKTVFGERLFSFHSYYPWIVVCITPAALWLFFEGMLLRLAPWFPAYLVLYPLSLFAGFGLERGLFQCVFRKPPETALFRFGSPYNVLALASAFLTMVYAADFGEALLLSFAFSAGGFLVVCVVKEIRKRSLWEAVPRALRGRPVTIISLGLLSLVFSASALYILKALLG